MPARKKPDPFQNWRDEQLGRQPATTPTNEAEKQVEPDRIRLSPGREAIRDQAIDRMLDAKEAGDVEAFERTSRELVDLNRQLFLEEQAELGALPETVEGAVAAINVATRVIEALVANARNAA